MSIFRDRTKSLTLPGSYPAHPFIMGASSINGETNLRSKYNKETQP